MENIFNDENLAQLSNKLTFRFIEANRKQNFLKSINKKEEYFKEFKEVEDEYNSIKTDFELYCKQYSLKQNEVDKSDYEKLDSIKKELMHQEYFAKELENSLKTLNSEKRTDKDFKLFAKLKRNLKSAFDKIDKTEESSSTNVNENNSTSNEEIATIDVVNSTMYNNIDNLEK